MPKKTLDSIRITHFFVLLTGISASVCLGGITPPSVTSTVIEKKLISDPLTYPAKISPRIEAQVLAEFDGQIESIQVKLGQKVKKRQALLSLRRTDPVYQYASFSVRSPIDGVVSLVEVSTASQAKAGQRLLTVIDPKLTKVLIEAAAADLDSLKTGLTGIFRPVGREDSFTVKISGVSPYIDPATGTATVELDLAPLNSGKPPVLPPGLMGKAEFNVRERSGIQVPEVAVIFKGKESFVRKLDGDTVKLAPVTLGNLKKGLYEILSGIEPGSKIVLHSSQYIGNGQKVEVQQDKAESFE